MNSTGFLPAVELIVWHYFFNLGELIDDVLLVRFASKRGALTKRFVKADNQTDRRVI